MDEVRSKAIPLRRKNGSGAGGAPTTATGRAMDALSASVRLAVTPPRLLWLAALGGTSLTLQAAQALLERMIAEGEAAERWLRAARERAA